MNFIPKLFAPKDASDFLARIDSLKIEMEQAADTTAEQIAAIEDQITSLNFASERLMNDHRDLRKVINKLDTLTK
jgi:ABC-type transporter Mla subunit MlaD